MSSGSKRPRDWNEATGVEEALQADTCATCGQRPPNAGHASCCRGCARNSVDECTCLLAADAPTYLLCRFCNFKTANMEEGFDTCCQFCGDGACECNDNRALPQGARGIRIDDPAYYDQSTDAPVATGMTPLEIATLPKWPAINGDANCLICLEVVKEGEMTLNLACTHSFHQGCLIPWLGMRATCPTCKLVTK